MDDVKGCLNDELKTEVKHNVGNQLWMWTPPADVSSFGKGNSAWDTTISRKRIESFGGKKKRAQQQQQQQQRESYLKEVEWEEKELKIRLLGTRMGRDRTEN